MTADRLTQALCRIDAGRLRRDLFHLARDPLGYRRLNHTRPGQVVSTLDEADGFIAARLEATGWSVEREAVPVQAFRGDRSKPKAHQYSTPARTRTITARTMCPSTSTWRGRRPWPGLPWRPC